MISLFRGSCTETKEDFAYSCRQIVLRFNQLKSPHRAYRAISWKLIKQGLIQSMYFIEWILI